MTLYNLWVGDDMGTTDTGDDYDFNVSDLAPGEEYTRTVSRSYIYTGENTYYYGDLKAGGVDILGHIVEDDANYGLYVSLE